MNLRTALRAGTNLRVAFVGAGGKTSAMFHLARQLDPPVIVTASTHLGAWQLGAADHHLVVSTPAEVEALIRDVAQGVNVITGAVGEDGRTGALPEDVLAAVLRLAEALGAALLVEADGSRQKALKAPAAHEPPIPAWVNCVVVVAGLMGLEKPLTDESVFRAEIFSHLGDVPLGAPIEGELLARYLLKRQGGLKNIPDGARRVALLNQADTDALRQTGYAIAQRLTPGYDAALVAALGAESTPAQVHTACEPIAGVVLAAGAAKRFGAPKVLAEWRGRPLVWHVAQTALQGGLWPVVVVGGALYAQIAAALTDLPVRVVENPDWQNGQSGSLRAGLAALEENTGAAVFLLADQPQTPVGIIKALRDAHHRTLAPVIAPVVDGRRANPVLFDRVTFDDLRALRGDVGGRALFDRFGVLEIPSDDSALLMDVDSAEDYRRLQEGDGAA